MTEYWKSRLDAGGKAAYETVYSSVSSGSTRVKIPFLPQQTVLDVYTAFICDHPEFFWLGNVSYAAMSGGILFGGLQKSVILNFDSLYSPSDRNNIGRELENIASSFISAGYGSETEREKQICEYLVRNVEYEINYRLNTNAASALHFKKAQCIGYAKAVKYLADKLGIWCIVLNGSGGDNPGKYEPHSWNIVRINGNYYHLDVTFMGGANRNKSLPMQFLYFNCTDAAFSDTHQWDKSTVPACTDHSFDGGANSFEELKRYQYPPIIKSGGSYYANTPTGGSSPFTTPTGGIFSPDMPTGGTPPQYTQNTPTGGNGQDVRNIRVQTPTGGQSPVQNVSRPAVPAGVKVIKSLYEFRRLLKERTGDSVKFVYQTDMDLKTQQQFLEQTFRDFCQENQICGQSWLMCRGGVWEITINRS